jgi:hypothetical protein
MPPPVFDCATGEVPIAPWEAGGGKLHPYRPSAPTTLLELVSNPPLVLTRAMTGLWLGRRVGSSGESWNESARSQTGSKMSFVGILEGFELPELWQILALAKKSGRLTLTRRDRKALMLFRRGRIIYAATDSVRESLGLLLVSSGMVDEGTLRQALDLQERDNAAKRLGDYLVKMGALRREELESVIRLQIERAAIELLSWEGGVCKFEPLEIAAAGEVEVDASDLQSREGIMTEHVLIKGLTELDEARGPEATSAAAAGAPGLPPAWATPEQSGEQVLRSLIVGVRSPNLTAEVVLKIQDCVTRAFGRGILFAVDHFRIRGVAAFGIGLEGRAKAGWVRDLVLPADQPSAFLPVVRGRRPFRGPLDVNPWNDFLVRQLGGPWPPEVVLVPAVVRGRVALICYADSPPGLDCMGATDDLELVMTQVALTMEKKLLDAEVAVT